MPRHQTPVLFFCFFVFGADKAQHDTEKKRKKRKEREKKTTRSFFKHFGINKELLVEMYPY